MKEEEIPSDPFLKEILQQTRLKAPEGISMHIMQRILTVEKTKNTIKTEKLPGELSFNIFPVIAWIFFFSIVGIFFILSSYSDNIPVSIVKQYLIYILPVVTLTTLYYFLNELGKYLFFKYFLSKRV